MRWHRFAGLILAGLLAACSGGRRVSPLQGGSAAGLAESARAWRRSGDKIDSILPMPEYLRRFRSGLPEARALSGGARSREDLARRFLSAVNRRDNREFGALVLSRAEFAWLVFPSHLYHDPPYELDPEIFWMQIRLSSGKGLSRTLERLGGHRLAFERLDCRPDTRQVRRGPVRIWSNCSLQFMDGETRLRRRLFGAIVELDGRYKLMSFSSDH